MPEETDTPNRKYKVIAGATWLENRVIGRLIVPVGFIQVVKFPQSLR
jgi:hypothetical protein